MDKTVTVIGAGIVGVCCALHLQREGFKVRLVEKGEPGRAASFGNSGSFGIASCVPFAMPGVLKKVPRMLFDPDSPLKLRWSHVPKALPWFLRFIEAARPSRVEAIVVAGVSAVGGSCWVSDALVLRWKGSRSASAPNTNWPLCHWKPIWPPQSALVL